MNAERLLSALANVGDDPARILQLRKLTVALAVSGRLNIGAASLSPAQLLVALDKVRAELIAKGDIPKSKKLPPVILEQLPENFADPWRFAPLGNIARIEKGQTGIQQAKPGQFPLVVTASNRSTCDHFDFEGAAAIVPLVSSTGHGNASINRLHYQEGQFALGTILVAIFPHAPDLVSARFLFEYLSAFKEELLVSRMTGTANVTLTVGRIAEVPIPLICPQTQRRVDELMALCDQLEAARTEREKSRDRVTAASLARLNSADAETFADDARFVLGNLPALTTRPDQIKQLRQTILNLAVRGKLVPQDRKDEPASELLSRIRTWQRQQIAKKAIRAPRKPLSSIESDNEPYRRPDGWVFARLGELIYIQSGDGLTAANMIEGPIPVFGGNGINGHHNKGNVAQPTLVIGRVGYYCGSIHVTPDRAWVTDNAFITHFSADDIYLSFLALLLKGTNLKEDENATAQPVISGTKIYPIVVGLPPLREQHRIVAKFDELMALCDQLEASLSSTESKRANLLEALLADALTDVNSLQEEAA